MKQMLANRNKVSSRLPFGGNGALRGALNGSFQIWFVIFCLSATVIHLTDNEFSSPITIRSSSANSALVSAMLNKRCSSWRVIAGELKCEKHGTERAHARVRFAKK